MSFNNNLNNNNNYYYNELHKIHSLNNIEIRSLNLDINYYSIIIKLNNDKNNDNNFIEQTIINSNKLTIIPNFPINNNNCSHNIFYLLNGCNLDDLNINYNKIHYLNIKLITTEDKKEILNFNISLPIKLCNFKFLGNDKINLNLKKKYPLIIFETNKGFYLFDKSNNNINKNIFNIKNYNNISDNFINNVDITKLLESYKIFSFPINLINDKKEEMKNKINNFYNNINNNNYKKLCIIQQYLINIQLNNEKSNDLKQKINKIKNLISYFKNLNKEKKSHLNNVKNSIKIYKENSILVKNKIIPKLLNYNIKLNYINTCLYKYYLKEFSYFYFNKILSYIYFIPYFYKFEFNPDVLNIRTNFYINYNQQFSTFFGFLISMIEYFSKKFEISYKENFLNFGSNSFIVYNKGKLYFKLFYNENNDQFIKNIKSENFEEGTNQIKLMLIQIYNFLKNLNLFPKKHKIKKNNLIEQKIEIVKKNKKNIFTYFLNICEFLNIINK